MEVRRLWGREGFSESLWWPAWDPEGHVLAAALSRDPATVVLLDAGGSPVGELRGHTAEVNGASWAPGGPLVATASADRTAKVWTRSGQAVFDLGGAEGSVESVSWSPDGQTLAASSRDRRVRAWDRNGRGPRILREGAQPLHRLQFSPNGRLAVGEGDAGVVLLDPASGKEVTLPHPAAALSLDWSPDGATLATAGKDGRVRLWSGSGGPAAEYELSQDWVTAVAWHPRGDVLAAGTRDGRLVLLAPGGGRLAERAYPAAVVALAWNPSLASLAVGTQGGPLEHLGVSL